MQSRAYSGRASGGRLVGLATPSACSRAHRVWFRHALGVEMDRVEEGVRALLVQLLGLVVVHVHDVVRLGEVSPTFHLAFEAVPS